MKFVIGITMAVAIGVLTTSNAQSRQLSVVTTVGMIGDSVERIAGDRVSVSTLVGTGVDPHTYRQTRSDIVKLGQADVIFCIGLYLEAQMDDLLKKLSTKQRVIHLGEVIDSSRILESAIYEDKTDPHIWMDVSIWSEVVDAIQAILAEMDPDGTEFYRSNASAYQAELSKLDAYTKQIVATIPENRRVLITAHDAFNYFGRAYGMEVMGIQGISTESEAGLSRIEELVDMIVAIGLPAVFVESSVSERNVKALVEGAGARGQMVKVGGELFSDAMGAPGTYEGTYIGMLDHNATRITLALGGTAPFTGMIGQLGVD